MEYEDVINVIKSLKTLFNQASALFILVSGEEFFTKLVKYSMERPTEYTLFPQKIFLQRPQFDDVRQFIDGILKNPNIEEIEHRAEFQYYQEAYHKFRNYLCYASKTDYFDLYNILRDYISFDEDGPRINIALEKKLETSANLQIALEAIYIRKKLENQSDWYKNDILLDTMYNLLYKLAERKSDTKFLKVIREPLFKLVFLNKNSEEIETEGEKDTPMNEVQRKESKEFSEMEKEAITDFIYYLVRLKFLNLSTETDKYEITGVLENVPSEIKTLTKEESDFMNQYKILQFLLVTYASLQDKYGVKLQ
jgi:cell division protein FtsL